MAIDNEMIIKSAQFGAIIGAGLALVSLIPVFMPIIALFILPFFAAPVVLILLKFAKVIDNIEIRDFATLGGIIGAVSGGVYLIIFCPTVYIIHLIFKNYYAYGINFLNIFLALILLLSITCIFMVTNISTALLTGLLMNPKNRN